jgi:hypothetical protein
MRELSGSAAISTSDLSRLAGGELATAGLDLASLDQLQLLVPSPVRRDPALEVEGVEGGGKPPAIIKIIIRHP